MRVALEELDFGYTPTEETKLREMWLKGFSLPDMAKKLRRPTLETFLLLADMSNRQVITARPGYLWGVAS